MKSRSRRDSADRSLKHWRERLLDLSRRNPLLYFNGSRGTKIRIARPGLEEVYDAIVVREKALTLPKPRPVNSDLEPPMLSRTAVDEQVDEQVVAEIPGDLSIDYSVGSARDVAELQRKLRRLWKNARASLEELGVNTLYLALGAVEWREAEQADSYDRAPLILVPAKLDPKDGDAFRLSCFERDARLNPVLDFKLRATYRVTLPSFDAYSGLDGGDPRPQEWLERVREVVGALDWRVRDEVWLSHFSFEKLVMYEDLGLPGTPEAVRGHPVLGALVQVREYEAKPVPSELSPPGAEAFDRPDLFPVVDADSSQLEVLAAVASGNSLTVEGPPGTGKSQTIVNIIAQALRKGKTVLFVSEKRAALEVVYRRLEQRGLDRFCLELHSHRTQRASLVSQLHAELDRVDESPDTVDEGEFEYRTALRRRLDEYVRELHEPRGKSRLTAFQVQGQLAKLSATPDVDAPLPLSAIDISPAQEREMREALRAITATSVWDRERDHPWRDAKPEGPEFVVGRNLDRTLEEFGVAIRALDDIGRRLRRSPCGSLKLGRVKDLPAVLTVLRALGEPPPAVVAVGGRIATDTMTAAREHVCSGLLVAGSDGKILSRYAKRYHRWWWRLTPMYVHDKLTIARAVGRRVRWQDALLLLTAATKYRKVFKQMAGIMGAPPGGRPDRLRGKSGDAGSIAVATAVLLGRLFEEGIRLPDDLARNLLRDPLAVHKIASQFSRELASVSNQLHRALPPIQGLFPSGIGGRAIPEIALGDLLGRIQSCREHLDLLDEWRNYVRALDRAGEIGLGPFLERGRAVGVSNLELEEAFVKRLRRRWLEEVYEQSSLLRDFDLRNHERVIEQFRFIDRSLVDKASILVERAVYDRREPVRTATGFASVRGRPGANRPDRMELIQRLKIQIRLLQREARKKQRHLPIRRLLPDIAELALLLKPCFLMSPLSVATYLPRDRFRFDVIIFDEASQVLPEDAVGTILRGEEVVIFGDSKQLPPTPFFRRLIDEDEDVGEREEETDTDSVAGFESILDLARTALPAKALRWHYRSRDERLISFSNHRFYSDRPLITFPSPRLSTDSTGVRLLVCEEGRWEPNLRRNLPEARLVVDLVMEHLERRPERSLGVIALGLGQAEAIDLELERRLSERPDLAAKRETFADEPLFVKNLENVQGDERDEIILSIGYGPEEPGGRVPMRFGPINQSGGERRLNVAVTRARYRTTVVASFEPQALLRAAELRPGPRYLHEYLVYAQREGRAMATPDANGSGRPESEFEEAVKSALEARGYLVDAQVGQSGYRIDLAVRDPEHPERYILAIECDGASYHSAPAIRDRDRLRQEQLESLGWQFHRIWSTDWIRDPDRALQRVIEAIERARRESPDDRAKGGG